MADQDAGSKYPGDRPRIPVIPAPLWAKALAKTATETVLEELAQLGAKHQSQREHRYTGKPSNNGAQKSPGEQYSEKKKYSASDGTESIRARLLEMLLSSEALRAVDPAVVTRWVEEQGADTWLLLMSKWERLSREVVDELLQSSASDRTKRTRGYFDKLERWEGLATFVIGKAIDFSLDTPEAKRARRHNRASGDDN